MERTKYPANQEFEIKTKAFFQGKKLVIRLELDIETLSYTGTHRHAGGRFLLLNSPKNISLLCVSHLPQEKTRQRTEETEEISTPKLLKSGKPCIQERNLTFLPLAEKLSKIVRSVKNVKHNLHQLKLWANDIRFLLEGSGIDYDRIDKALDGYAKIIGGEYVPVIESGRSLRLKFLRLEDAINRDKISVNGKPRSIIDDGIEYKLCPDGKYRHPRTGSIYIP